MYKPNHNTCLVLRYKSRSLTEADLANIRVQGFDDDLTDDLRLGYDPEFGTYVLQGDTLIWTSSGRHIKDYE